MLSLVKVLVEVYNLFVFQLFFLCLQDNQWLVVDFGVDIMVVVVYGLILFKVVLEMFCLGCINVYGLLLLCWCGVVLIQCLLWVGDSEIGVIIMQMDVGFDMGDMLYKFFCFIIVEDISGSLYDKLVEFGLQGLLVMLVQLVNGIVWFEV